MNPGRRARRYRKVIDQWWFGTDTKYHEREIVVFNIVLHRDADMQEGRNSLAVTPRAHFEAILDGKNSSPAFASAKVTLKSDDLNKLRRECQKSFEELTAKDWVKVILVACSSDDGHFKVNRELQFAWAVCERGGDLYRREDGWVTRDRNAICGGNEASIRELPYSEDTERSLELLDLRLQDLARAIDRLFQDPAKLNAVAKSMPPLLT